MLKSRAYQNPQTSGHTYTKKSKTKRHDSIKHLETKQLVCLIRKKDRYIYIYINYLHIYHTLPALFKQNRCPSGPRPRAGAERSGARGPRIGSDLRGDAQCFGSRPCGLALAAFARGEWEMLGEELGPPVAGFYMFLHRFFSVGVWLWVEIELMGGSFIQIITV